MRVGTRKLGKSIVVWTTLAFVGVWLALVTAGRRLPYLELDSSATWRSAIIFIVLYGTCFYFLYLKRVPSTGVSAARTHYDAAGGGARGLTQVVGSGVGAIFICGALALTSFAPVAVFTGVAATKPATGVYRLTSVEGWGGGSRAGMRRLKALDESGRPITLNVKSADYSDQFWESGSLLCLSGRKWAFGMQVDSIRKDVADCGRASPETLVL